MTDEIRCSLELAAKMTPRSIAWAEWYGDRSSGKRRERVDRPEIFAAEQSSRWPPEGIIINLQHNRQAPCRLRAVPVPRGQGHGHRPDAARSRLDGGDAGTHAVNVREKCLQGHVS